MAPGLATKTSNHFILIILWVRNLDREWLGHSFAPYTVDGGLLVVLSCGCAGLETDRFSHMSGAFVWMAGSLGSAGPLIRHGGLRASGLLHVDSGSKSRCSSEQSESYWPFMT